MYLLHCRLYIVFLHRNQLNMNTDEYTHLRYDFDFSGSENENNYQISPFATNHNDSFGHYDFDNYLTAVEQATWCTLRIQHQYYGLKWIFCPIYDRWQTTTGKKCRHWTEWWKRNRCYLFSTIRFTITLNSIRTIDLLWLQMYKDNKGRVENSRV